MGFRDLLGPGIRVLFLTNAGRINRQAFWIGHIMLAVVKAVLDAILVPTGGNDVIARIGGNDLRVRILVSFMTTLALVYPAINLGIKRYHDRGKSGWWVFICWGPIISIITISFFRGIRNPNQSDWPEQLIPVMKLIPFVMVIGWLWYFIETGFLPGTKGPNRYGPDPLD